MEERREELVRFKSNFAGTDVCIGGREEDWGGRGYEVSIIL